MPLYDYQCGACGERSEHLQKMRDALIKQCPHCKENKLKRLVSPTRFKLEGTGWYETDFSGKQKKAPETEGDKKTQTKKEDSKKTTSGGHCEE